MEDYEKKYKETLNRAREIHRNEDEKRSDMEWLFPELKESKDERIRKALIKGVESCKASGWTNFGNNVDIDVVLAWLEKQGEQKPIDYNKELKKCRENPLYFFDKYVKLEKQKPACSEEDERVKKRILLSLEKDLMATKNSGCDTQDLEQCIAWLEKQGESYTKKDIDDAYLKGISDAKNELEKQCEQKQFYIRFGDIPEGEKSSVWRGDEFLGKENGVSVYPAFKHNGNIVLGLSLPITKTTLHTQQHLLEYDNRPCYLVKGDYIGNGADGEPLIRNVEIVEEIKDFRVKEGEARYEVKAGDSLSVNGKTFDYEKATITQKDFASVGETATIELSSPIDCGDRIYHVSHKPIEKQGEQKPAVTDFNAKDWYVSKVDGKIHDMTYNPADKVEPKVEEKIEDEIEIPFGAKDSELQEATYYIPKGFHAEIDDDKVVIKKGEKPAAWSDEDDAYKLFAISAVEDYYDEENPLQKELVDWLKSLKDRIGG